MRLSAMQIRIGMVGIAVFVLMGLFPPWVNDVDVATDHQSLSREWPAGYSLIFVPPKPPAGSLAGIRIDLIRLLIQWGVVISLTCLGMLLAKSGGSHHEDSR